MNPVHIYSVEQYAKIKGGFVHYEASNHTYTITLNPAIQGAVFSVAAIQEIASKRRSNALMKAIYKCVGNMQLASVVQQFAQERYRVQG